MCGDREEPKREMEKALEGEVGWCLGTTGIISRRKWATVPLTTEVTDVEPGKLSST